MRRIDDSMAEGWGAPRLATRFASAATSHLLIQNGRAGETGEHQIDHFRAIKACVEHVDRDENLWKCFALEALDFGGCVHRVVGTHA